MDFTSLFKKANLNLIYENFPDGLLLTASDGKILYANKKAKELVNAEPDRYISEFVDTNIGVIENLAETQEQSVFKLTGENADGYVEISVSKISKEDKFVITIRNVTQSHKFMKKMLVETESSKKVNKDKNTFLVKLSNDLKSPLHSIDGFSKALLEGMGGEITDKQSKYLNIINKNAQDLLFLMDRIIEMSKNEAGLYEWNYKHLDIVNLLQQVVRPYKEILAQKNIEFLVEIEDDLKRTCFADENALKTIMDTLVDTAVKSTYLGKINIKFSHPELEYVIEKGIECPETAGEKSFIQMSITDTGSGMTESEKAYIFDPYYQLESGNKKNLPKSLALAVIKYFVNQMRGLIWVEGDAMQGSTFTFIIPNERLTL